MSIEAVSQLYFFAVLFAAIPVGGLVGWLTRFEIGLGVGLLLPGLVAAYYFVQFVQQYQRFTNPLAPVVVGKVIAIEEIPVSGGTQYAPIVEYLGAAGQLQRARGPRATSFKSGDTASVLSSPAGPEIADISNLRGGAIAMALFGTFLLSTASFFLLSGEGKPNGGPARKLVPRRVKPLPKIPTALTASRRRLMRDINWLMYLLMFSSITWIAYGKGELLMRFATGFGGVALGIFGYIAASFLQPMPARVWRFGMAVVGINFGVWAVALYLLRPVS